jgi:hypothetical protein
VLGTKNADFKVNKFELCIFHLLSLGADTSDKHFTELEKNSLSLKLGET